MAAPVLLDWGEFCILVWVRVVHFVVSLYGNAGVGGLAGHCAI